MRMYDVILKKREGGVLTKEEIAYVIEGYTKGDIPDYQVSALLMAIMFKGMGREEIANLTMSMARSGDMMDLSSISGVKVDKHSTGGVGDKVSLIVAPIVAACGVSVAKMSGRGLGHTGGTVDKLEAIPGYKTEMEVSDFIKQVQDINIALIGQTGDIAPADKKIYALRDVTATVDNVALIAASIMSKKLASGADVFLLDVKLGSGAFAKTEAFAKELAETMVGISEENGKRAKAMITNMDQPLGEACGNWLEILEVVDVLQNKGPEDVRELSLKAAEHLLFMADKGTQAECRDIAEETLKNGVALNKFKELISRQGGDVSYIDNPEKYPRSHYIEEYLAEEEGYISKMNTEHCGIASVVLGAGRSKKEDVIDFKAGIMFHKKVNAYVKKGDVIATLYTSKSALVKEAKEMLDEAITISPEKGKEIPLFIEL